jgi:hydroxyacylglutathione hydrolase
VKQIGLPLTHLVCTHSHKDHSPAADQLAILLDIPRWGAGTVDDPFQDRNWQPERVLADNESVELGGMHLKAIATPGHVSNHLCYLLEDEHWLFSGDHLINGSTVVIIPPAGSMSDYMRSLVRLQQEKIDIIAPGHGDLIDQPMALIDNTLMHRKAREDKVATALAAAPGSTPQELVPKVYQDVGVHLHMLAALSLSAHLIKLGEEGRAHENKGRWFPVA